MKSHTFFLVWTENNLSSMGFYDLFGNAKAKTGTPLFCGKKRMKAMTMNKTTSNSS